LKDCQLDLNSELELILQFLFNDYQKLYHQKEMTHVDKTSGSLYQRLIENVKKASLQAND